MTAGISMSTMVEVESKSIKSFHKTHKALTESEVVAIHQLMQISDEDSDSNNVGKMKRQKGNNNLGYEEAEPDRTSLSAITSRKIEEIFGKEDEAVIFNSQRKKKYRSIKSIYRGTRPIDV